MRKLIWIFLLLLTFESVSVAQDSINPADTILLPAILKDFAKRYPKAEIDDWVKDSTFYVVSTFASNLWLDVTYSEKGKWLHTATLIDYEQLPQAVINTFESSKYKDYEVVKTAILEMPKKPKIFKIYLENIQGEAVLLNYNESGSLVL